MMGSYERTVLVAITTWRTTKMRLHLKILFLHESALDSIKLGSSRCYTLYLICCTRRVGLSHPYTYSTDEF